MHEERRRREEERRRREGEKKSKKKEEEGKRRVEVQRFAPSPHSQSARLTPISVRDSWVRVLTTGVGNDPKQHDHENHEKSIK